MNVIMKIGYVNLLAMLLVCGSSLAQNQSTNAENKPPPPAPPSPLTKFDLDFKGGHPKDLIAAIEKATGKPLNVLISDEYADVNLPALKMKNVYVPQLFNALEQASLKKEYIKNPDGSFATYGSICGFRPNAGTVTDDTIWNFHAEKPNPPPPHNTCRFYYLGPYLDWGLSIDDITTAIKTGAKMLGDNGEPTMSFHKDTRLLIAVGEPARLEIIDSVLKALQPPANASVWHNSPKPSTSAPKSSEEKSH